jgi:hypothetical protein
VTKPPCKTEGNLIAFLSADAVGRPSPLKTIFGSLERAMFAATLKDFSQRIADKFYDGKFEVVVAPRIAKEAAHQTQPEPPAQPDQPQTKIGDRSEPTPNGFFCEFVKNKNSYAVRDKNNPNLGILCECKNKADEEMKVATYEREARQQRLRWMAWNFRKCSDKRSI